MSQEKEEIMLSNAESKINIIEWLSQNQQFLQPPVSNKMLFNKGDLKVMIVGGPNQRKDYHYNETEEFFYQMKGDMILKVIENGEFKDIKIKEGEMFVLPGKVSHSPQRFENTIGLVIEINRNENQLDKLQWYCDDCKSLVYEEIFHCTDLGTQLVPVIERYRNNIENRTCKNCNHVNEL
ncbi:hypothetical protein ABK040_008254 [Willaertia magna]